MTARMQNKHRIAMIVGATVGRKINSASIKLPMIININMMIKNIAMSHSKQMIMIVKIYLFYFWLVVQNVQVNEWLMWSSF